MPVKEAHPEEQHSAIARDTEIKSHVHTKKATLKFLPCPLRINHRDAGRRLPRAYE